MGLGWLVGLEEEKGGGCGGLGNRGGGRMGGGGQGKGGSCGVGRGRRRGGGGYAWSLSPGRLLSWVCPVAGPVVGPVSGAGRAKILRYICVRPGFGKRVGRWRVKGGRLRVVPFSTGVSRVTLVSFSLRLRFSWVTKMVDLLSSRDFWNLSCWLVVVVSCSLIGLVSGLAPQYIQNLIYMSWYSN